MAKLLNYGSGVSKEKKTDYWYLTIYFPNNIYKNVVGFNTRREFISEEVFKTLRPDMIDKEVDFETSNDIELGRVVINKVKLVKG